MTSDQKKDRSLRLRFSVRTLVIVVTLAAY
jgi:hypothetical protein